MSKYSRDFGYTEYRDDPVPSYNTHSRYQETGYGDFSKLCEQATSNTYQINSNATSLERLCNQLGTDSDTTELREKSHDIQQKTNVLISKTTKIFQDLSRIKVNRTEKLTIAKVQSDFQQTIQRYSTLQKKTATKAKSTKPKSNSQSLISGPPDIVGWGADDDDDEQLLREQQRREQLQAQQLDIETDLEYAQEREEQIRQLEGDILDINEIFRELACLVHEQGEMVDSIEHNVIKASENVETGNEQLNQASKYAVKYRKKLCVLFIILGIVAAVIIIIVVVETRK